MSHQCLIVNIVYYTNYIYIFLTLVHVGMEGKEGSNKKTLMKGIHDDQKEANHGIV